MPLVRKRPTGRTTRSTVEAYHFQPLRNRKKVVRLNALVPDNETASNPRYVDVEERLNIPCHVKVHDCRVVIGADMYLVTGYWYRHSDINQSIMATTGLTWRGELIVIRAGRYIPYLKRVNCSRLADVAVMRFIHKYKLCSDLKKRFPTMIVV
ncbi:hypothetical protein BDM02DRAFT_3191012 [Thelephora ganbajun]|uniref:Uncharacterized protein n=1 Tax=Thelephora ganbajun TaxID=370292 RepID=A0ACB6Z388_THEGA|nr:hypothetical protein BDM02DRAFT_3191012 [Thelephora ganbajun]